MYVSSHTLRQALLRIFTEAVANPGESLSFSEIARTWSRTGLRDLDLRIAVRELVESGDLHPLQRNGTLGFTLNAAGPHRPPWQGSELQLAMAAGE